MGGVGFFFEETQGLGRPISSGCRVFNHFVKFDIFGSFLGVWRLSGGGRAK